jgi:Thermolysin metallopeptidase, catalytic domain
MPAATQPRTRQLTVIAQDPALQYKDGRIVTARITVPAETLGPGPSGYRVRCVDYDSTTDTYYDTGISSTEDAYENASNEVLLNDPSFHCQNAYAYMMHTLSRFEFALGRRLGWSFKGHQLTVAPHAFSDANAFYSEEDRALLFGYFPSHDGKSTIYCALSHDVVVHETTHALIDGLRTRYTDPSSPDQAAFHEGFADIVALLSVFSLPAIAEFVIDANFESSPSLISAKALNPEALRKTLFGLARQVGQELSGVRGQPLRRSMELKPDKTYLDQAEFQEPHRRGEVLVAALMNAFLHIWSTRISRLGEKKKGMVDRGKVIEEGADLADLLLTSAIRALDYAPPVDLSFKDYLSALLTADEEVRPRGDDRYELRRIVRRSFESYGIAPACDWDDRGVWSPANRDRKTKQPIEFNYGRIHYEPMQRDPDEVFHFVWENRTKDHLGLMDDGYTDVQSVRPCLRIGADGFMLRETVAEYVQVLKIHAVELAELGLKKPIGMEDAIEFYLYGGGSLIFDEFGQLKYHIFNPLLGDRQEARLQYLFDNGFFSGKPVELRFSSLHRMRSAGEYRNPQEGW